MGEGTESLPRATWAGGLGGEVKGRRGRALEEAAMKRSREVGGVWMEDSWPRKDLLAYLLWEE